MRVVCLEPRRYPHHKVGESLDWSSPGLLRRVGIDTDALLADGIATYKRKIVVCEVGKAEWPATPPPAIRRSPLRFETVTLHVDRTALDARLFEHASELGTEFIWERVTTVHAERDRITGCSTADGQHVDARWYVDASGTARVVSRALKIPTVAYGQQKVCLWTYFDTAPLADGTVFFIDNGDQYLSWVWDIPISPDRTSVGFVLPADTVRDRRQSDRSVEAILRTELLRYPRFRSLLDAHPTLEIESTSFQPYATMKVCGDNWFMVGEAAAMPDPLTGNGVTSGHPPRTTRVRRDRRRRWKRSAHGTTSPSLRAACVPAWSCLQRAHRERDLSTSDPLGAGVPGGDVHLYAVRVLHERAARALRASRLAGDERVQCPVRRRARLGCRMDAGRASGAVESRRAIRWPVTTRNRVRRRRARPAATCRC